MTHTPLRPARSAEPELEPEPGRSRRGGSRRGWVVAGTALVLIALGGGAYALSQRGPATSPSAVQAGSAVAGGTGTEGPFSLTVTGTRCGVQQVGPADLPQRPTGQFCLVDVAVKNTGREADLLDGGAQRALDNQGKSYPVDDRASVFLNDQNPSLLEEIQPGATVRGVLPFDVPAGIRLSAVMLHAAMDTPGVRVPLS